MLDVILILVAETLVVSIPTIWFTYKLEKHGHEIHLHSVWLQHSIKTNEMLMGAVNLLACRVATLSDTLNTVKSTESDTKVYVPKGGGSHG